jgi:hypothetical protein
MWSCDRLILVGFDVLRSRSESRVEKRLGCMTLGREHIRRADKAKDFSSDTICLAPKLRYSRIDKWV